MSKKNCMFQYVRSNRWTSDIYEDTDLITLEEAKALWAKYLPQFIKELQEEGERPEMVIWTGCDSASDYHTEYAHVDENTETDGTNLWNVTRSKVSV